jgi:predicted neuraminidase
MKTHPFRQAPRSSFLPVAVASGMVAGSREIGPPGLVASGFVYDSDPPTAACHASTIVEARRGFLAAWFGGTDEGEPDVAIYLARLEEGKWSKPAQIIDGLQTDGRRFPCWNPVLFRPRVGPILLFAKVGPSPSKWWGVVTSSEDDGQTWSRVRRLPDGILGPIKNKPIELLEGPLLCPSSHEDPKLGWRVFLERTADLGLTWTKVGPLNDGIEIGAIQPSILTHRGGRLQILCRTRQGKLAESWSSDEGKTWSPMALTALPNPNSGTDAVTLADGRQVLVFNPIAKGRTPLAVALSEDGRSWQMAMTLEDQPGEYSYPAVIQDANGLIHSTYTWKRTRIKHVVIDPKFMKPGEGDAGRNPAIPGPR